MTVTKPAIGQLLARLDVLETPLALQTVVADLADHPAPRVISFLNAYAVNLASHNISFLNALMGSDLLFRDGIGLKIACWLTHRKAGLNLNGTDLIPKIIAAFSNRRVVLCGGRQKAVMEAAANLSRQGVNVVLALDGYEEEEAYINAARKTRPELVILGMGMPKQESLAHRLKATCTAERINCTIINGGAIIDFLGGRCIGPPGG